MSTLDSRSLRNVDCFAQRFTTPGEIAYHITPTARARIVFEPAPFKIRIRGELARRERHRDGKQHFVTVRREVLRLTAEPPELEIAAGDVVLWNTPDAEASGYVVHGEGAGGSFDSTTLTAEAVYTHAFGLPGEFRWADANGSSISGLVTVRQVNSKDEHEIAAWADRIKNGVLVVISGDRVEPREVDILVGQTVFFAVVKAAGITITDNRLL